LRFQKRLFSSSYSSGEQADAVVVVAYSCSCGDEERDEEILGRNVCKDEICLISGCRLWRELLLLAIDEE
jgi:hypothetical protein